jgi:hypothetical protein
MIRAVSVRAGDDYCIVVNLEDGRVVKMDMAFIKAQSGPVVDPIKDLSEFRKAFIRDGIVTWKTGFDIDPYFLIEETEVISSEAAS